MKHCDSSDRRPHPFAPGVVQGYRVPLLGTAQQRRELRRLGAATLWWLAGCTAAAFALGWALGALA